MSDLNETIKKAFGEKFKMARNATGYSRAKLSVELGVSAKTIQSWETGRTFPENMSLIPEVEKKLGFFIPDILSETVREEVAKSEEKSPSLETEPTIRRAAVTEEDTEEHTDVEDIEEV